MLPYIFHVRMQETDFLPDPVFPIIQLQVCRVMPFTAPFIHDIIVKDGHGMVTCRQYRPLPRLCPGLPVRQAGTVRRHRPKSMPDGGPPEIGGHLIKEPVKIEHCTVLLRVMHQVLCLVKPPVPCPGKYKFIPYTVIDRDQPGNSLPV